MTPGAQYIFVTPSLATSGGNIEIIKLARQLQERGAAVILVAIWATPHALQTGTLPICQLSDTSFSALRALVQLPALIIAFARLLGKRGIPGLRVVLSHYTTFPLGWVVRRKRRWFFVQDTEWNFVPAGARRSLTRFLILAHLRRGQVLTANSYLANAMSRLRIEPAARISIWADPGFLGDPHRVRTVDVAMVLRHGAHKRADLVRSFIRLCAQARPQLKLAVITPDASLLEGINADLVECIIRPDGAAMRNLYECSRLTVLFSEHEGFGLPPLEAMASGCVPLCRDAGGIRSYMTGDLAANIVPLEATLEDMLTRVLHLLHDHELWAAQSALSVRLFREGMELVDRRLELAAAAAFVDDIG